MLLDKTVFKVDLLVLVPQQGEGRALPLPSAFGEGDAGRPLPVLGPSGKRNSLAGRAPASRSASWRDERFTRELADLKLKRLWFPC